MKKSIKVLSLLLVFSLAMSLLCGCAPTAESETTGTTAPAESKDVPTLIWYTIGEQPDDLAKVMDTLNPILEEKIGARLDLRLVSNADYDEKINTIINSGEKYDICFTSDWAGNYVINSRKGAFLDLTPYLEGDCADLKEAIDARFWQGANVDGGVYAVPTYKELPYSPSWAFTKELVEKYDFDVSGTLSIQDLEPMLKTIKENEPEIIPLPLRASDIPGIIDNYDIPASRELPAYVAYDDESTTVVNPFEQEDVVANLHTIHDYYVKGYINQDAATNKQKLKNRLIYAGWYCPGAEQIWGNSAGYEIVCAPRYDNYYATTSCIGSMQAVSANSKNPEAAVKFLQALNTDPEIKNMITYGLEGVHYNKTGDNSIELTEDSAKYALDYYTLGNHTIAYTVDPQAKDIWDQFLTFNDTAKASVLFGFSFNSDNVKTEYASIMSITGQYYPQLMTGSVSDVDATLKEMNEKLYAAGLEKVMAEMQTQINDWKAAK